MKRLFQLGAFCLGLLLFHNVDAQPFGYGGGGPRCDAECPSDQFCGDCWCRYVKYCPCYYNTTRCFDECIPCKKRCCRYVPQYYQVQRCRYVPEYYCETKCRQVPEYYDVEDVRVCKRSVCEQHCRYVPRYYWKRVCGDACSQIPARF